MLGILSSDKYINCMLFSLGSREGITIRIPLNFLYIILL